MSSERGSRGGELEPDLAHRAQRVEIVGVERERFLGFVRGLARAAGAAQELRELETDIRIGGLDVDRGLERLDRFGVLTLRRVHLGERELIGGVTAARVEADADEHADEAEHAASHARRLPGPAYVPRRGPPTMRSRIRV